MVANTASHKLFHLEAVDRLVSIPIVCTSFKRAEQIYGRVKNQNRLFSWYFETAEATIYAACESVQPIIEIPLRHLDTVMCKSLDILEQRIPLVYLPPEMMYWNTKEYMSERLVRPVLKRADSVKQIRNAVLENSLTTYAADRIDGAFTAGEKFVDKYLLPIEGDQDTTDAVQADNIAAAAAENEKGAIRAIHHGQRISRKLRRRLTFEVRAIKKQSKEAVNLLTYAAELIATDPKMALQKARELWDYLSKDEPENQARPVTLEQLILMLTRESARRLVHFVNFGASVAANLPKTVSHTTTEVVHHIIYYNNWIVSITKLDKVKTISKEEAESLLKRMLTFYGNLQGLTNGYLERLASFLSGRIEAEKVSGSSANRIITVHQSSAPTRRRIMAQQNNSPAAPHNNINGVY